MSRHVQQCENRQTGGHDKSSSLHVLSWRISMSIALNITYTLTGVFLLFIAVFFI